MSEAPPGWYHDDHGVVRWFDGEHWTDDVQPSSLPVTEPEPAPEPGQRARRPAVVGVLVVVLLLVLGGLVLAGARLAQRDEPTGATGATGATTGPTGTPGDTATSPGPPPETPTPTAPREVGPSPDVVARRFLSAVVAVDCPTLERLSTPGYLERQGRCDDDVPADALRGVTHQQRPAAVAGASATVGAVITRPGGSGRPRSMFRFTLTLVETETGWRVNDLAALS